MLQQLTALLPDALTHRPPAFAAVMAAAGLGLWLVGGRFSRGLLCLALCAAGALVGMRMPRWFAWGIDGAALGIGGAIALGASGYFLDRFWTGVLLGSILAFWAGLAAWAAVAPAAHWSASAFQSFQWTPDPVDLVLQVWRTLPDDLRTAVPLAAGLAMSAGILTSILWPRLSRAIAFSLLGLSVWVTVVIPVAARERPDWAAILPRGTTSEIVLLSGLLAIGTAVQWWFIGREPKAGSQAPSPSKAAAGPADRGRGDAKPAQMPQRPKRPAVPTLPARPAAAPAVAGPR